jgi:hypothetical protein
MPGNSHVRFGERDGETDLSNGARRTISTQRLRRTHQIPEQFLGLIAFQDDLLVNLRKMVLFLLCQ